MSTLYRRTATKPLHDAAKIIIRSWHPSRPSFHPRSDSLFFACSHT